jgi:hypothetical protein
LEDYSERMATGVGGVRHVTASTRYQWAYFLDV